MVLSSDFLVVNFCYLYIFSVKCTSHYHPVKIILKLVCSEDLYFLNDVNMPYSGNTDNAEAQVCSA